MEVCAGGGRGKRGNGAHMSAQGTAYVCRTSIQGETTHNAHTGPGREEVRGAHHASGLHTIRRRGVGSTRTTRGAEGAPESHTHTCTTHAGPTQAHITARVHMAAQKEGGGRVQREGDWGFGRRTHRYERMAIPTVPHVHQGTAHSTATQRGGKVGRAANQSGNTAQRKQKTVPARNKTTHQVRDSPGGGEGCVRGCGLWGTALVQCWGGPITGTTEPRGLDGVGGGGERERERG